MSVHHQFKKGQKVLIIKKDNSKVVDRYYGTTSKFLKLNNSNIKWEDIRCSTIYKDRKGDNYNE